MFLFDQNDNLPDDQKKANDRDSCLRGNIAKLFPSFWRWSLTTCSQSWYQRKLNLYDLFFNSWYWQQQWFVIGYSSKSALKGNPSLFVVHKFHHNGEIWKLTTFYPSKLSVSKSCQFFPLKVRPILFAITHKDHSGRERKTYFGLDLTGGQVSLLS